MVPPKDEFALTLDPNGSFYPNWTHLEYQQWNLNACDRRKQTNGIKP
jgi:hypothetical protein